MTTDEILRAWAARRFGVEGVARVEIIDYEGFGGSDVTPPEPPSMAVHVFNMHGRCIAGEVNLPMTGDLIREILEAAQ